MKLFLFKCFAFCVFEFQIFLDTVLRAVYTGAFNSHKPTGKTMNQEPQNISPMFRIDVSPGSHQNENENPGPNQEVVELLRHLVMGQDRQNELLEEMVDQMGAAQRQRAAELGQWKEANPVLARRCRTAAESLSQVQTEFLENLTHEINDNFESMMDGEFVLNEFVDRFGPRLAHLNGVLQLLAQLSSVPTPTNHTQ